MTVHDKEKFKFWNSFETLCTSSKSNTTLEKAKEKKGERYIAKRKACMHSLGGGREGTLRIHRRTNWNGGKEKHEVPPRNNKKRGEKKKKTRNKNETKTENQKPNQNQTKDPNQNKNQTKIRQKKTNENEKRNETKRLRINPSISPGPSSPAERPAYGLNVRVRRYRSPTRCCRRPPLPPPQPRLLPSPLPLLYKVPRTPLL